MTTKQRVLAGAQFLTKTYGVKWKKKVKLDSLDLESSSYCILGQTDSDFSEHRTKLELSYKKCEDYGFIKKNAKYKSLTKTWKEYLVKGNL